jgi:hypothetical protein
MTVGRIRERKTGSLIRPTQKSRSAQRPSDKTSGIRSERWVVLRGDRPVRCQLQGWCGPCGGQIVERRHHVQAPTPSSWIGGAGGCAADRASRSRACHRLVHHLAALVTTNGGRRTRCVALLRLTERSGVAPNGGRTANGGSDPFTRLLRFAVFVLWLRLCQSFQRFLNRSGAISVYRTVCMIFLWPK